MTCCQGHSVIKAHPFVGKRALQASASTCTFFFTTDLGKGHCECQDHTHDYTGLLCG